MWEEAIGNVYEENFAYACEDIKWTEAQVMLTKAQLTMNTCCFQNFHRSIL